MAEKKLEAQIIRTLRMLGFYVFKTASHGGCYDYNINFNEAGISDLVVIGGEHRIIFIEVKTAKGKQSINQKVFEEICKKNNIKYALVRSKKEALEAVATKRSLNEKK